MAKDIKTKRITELFGEENIDKVSLFLIEHQSGFPSCIDNPDFWLSTTMKHDELIYLLEYLSYCLRKYKPKTSGLGSNMKILEEILYKCYGCAGYIPNMNSCTIYNKNVHIDVSMADYEAWLLCKNNKEFPINPDFPNELTEKNLEKYFRKMI